MKEILVLCKPQGFGYNPETAKSNYFMHPSDTGTQDKALVEFTRLVSNLSKHSIDHVILNDPGTTEHPTQDAVFVNNWFIYLPSGDLILCPMRDPSRSFERANCDELIANLDELNVPVVLNDEYVHHEIASLALEGTGSIVFDHENRIAYAVRSMRTSEALFKLFCCRYDYTPLLFDAFDEQGKPIYHTNVMMSVMKGVALIASESIKDKVARKLVLNTLEQSGRVLIDLDVLQLASFVANVIDVASCGKNYLLLSQLAYEGYNPLQREALERHFELIVTDVTHIEKIAGGSVRCMVAKISYQASDKVAPNDFER